MTPMTMGHRLLFFLFIYSTDHGREIMQEKQLISFQTRGFNCKCSVTADIFLCQKVTKLLKGKENGACKQIGDSGNKNK